MAQAALFSILGLTLALFIWGRWRYDVVAGLALLAAVLLGLVPRETAFYGFGHPAVITVAAVLVLSRGLENAGVVDALARGLNRVGTRPTVQVGALTLTAALLSAFMNNVGALALLLPVALQMARNARQSPSVLLMPLAFASLLGGLTTLIGTPPNIIIATARNEVAGAPFRMFDFSPVGVGVALAGVAFITLIGWRLIPRRKAVVSQAEAFEVAEYITELRAAPESDYVGRALGTLPGTAEGEVVVAGLVRDGQTRPAPSPYEVLRPEDILIVEADTEDLEALVAKTGFELVGEAEPDPEALGSAEVSLQEAVVMSNSYIEGRTPRTLALRERYGTNLLAIARQGRPVKRRLSRVRFRAGDVLLLQGTTETLHEAVRALGLLPLAPRDLRLGAPPRLALTLLLFAGPIALAALGVLPVAVALAAGALGMVVVNIVSLREAYDAVEWPIIILLGALIPVGAALETTGAAQTVAGGLLWLARQLPAEATLVVLLVGTMFLSDVINNAAAAVLMAPIAIHTAGGLGVSADPFLMAVAIGASSAFLTPVGHQANTLVMGPGGYRFGDYWRLGLLVELVIVVTAVPLLLRYWPLTPVP